MTRSILRSVVAASLVAGVAAHIACGGGGGRRIQMPGSGAPGPAADAARTPLEGEWTLVGFEANGTPRRASGFLRYDRFATITVKAELTGDEPSARPPRTVVADFTAKATPAGGQLDYVGLQNRSDPGRMAQEAVRMDEWRHFEVDGNTLRLFVRGGGGQPAAILTFERAQ